MLLLCITLLFLGSTTLDASHAAGVPTGNVSIFGPSEVVLSLNSPDIIFTINTTFILGVNNTVNDTVAETVNVTLYVINETFAVTVITNTNQTVVRIPILDTNYLMSISKFTLQVETNALLNTSSTINVTIAKVPIILAVPTTFYINAEVYPVLVELPPALAAMQHRTLVVQKVIESTPPISITPSSLTYNKGELGLQQYLNFSGETITYNYEAQVVISGNATLFVYLNNVSGLYVENQTKLDVSIVPQQRYFIGSVVEFDVSVLWLPYVASGNLYIGAVDGINVATQSLGQLNSTTSSRVALFSVKALQEGVVTVQVLLSGIPKRRYYIVPEKLYITVVPALYIEAPIKSTSLTSIVNTVPVFLSAPAAVSVSIRIMINASSPNVTIVPNQLEWFGGNNVSKSFEFSCPLEGIFSIYFTGYSYDATGKPNFEFTGDFRPQLINVSFNNVLAVTSTFPAFVIAQRSVDVTVSVPRVPSGTLIVTFTTIPTGGVSLLPLQVSFTNSILSQTITLTVTDPTLKKVNITTALSGTGQAEFERVPMYNITVFPPIPVVTNLSNSLLVGTTTNIRVGLQEPPPPNTTVTVTMRCTYQGSTILTFAPSNTLVWGGGDVSVHIVTIGVVNSTGAVGTLCNWTVVGSGYASFSKYIVARIPQNISITSSADKLYGGEVARLLFNIKFPAITVTVVTVSCVLQSGALCTSTGGRLDKTTFTFQPFGAYNDTITYTSPDSQTSTDRVQLSFVVASTSGEFILPTDSTLRYNVTIVPKRWLRVSGIPALTFAGDNLTIGIAIQELPAEGLFVRAQVQGFPNTFVKWLGNNTPQTPDTQLVVISLVESITTLFVELAASLDTESLKYQRTVTVPIVVKPKLVVTFSPVATFQLVEEPNGQDVVVRISRYPLLSHLLVRGVFTGSNAAMLQFSPPYLEWRNDTVGGTPPTANMKIIGQNVGTASNVSFVLEIDTKEVTRTAIAVQSSLTILPLKQIAVSVVPKSTFSGTSTSQFILVKLSQAPSAGSSLTIRLAIIPATLASLATTSVTFTNTTNTTQVVYFTGLVVGSGQVNVTIVYGPEYMQTPIGDLALTIRPPVAYSVMIGGVPVTSSVTIAPDSWVDMELVAGESIPGVSRTVGIILEVFSCDLPISTAAPVSQVSGNTSIFSVSKTSHSFRIAAAALSNCIFNLNFTSTSHREFANIPTIQVVVPSLPLLNVTSFPSLVVVGSQNALSFSVGAFPGITAGTTLKAELLLTGCNASIALVTPSAPLQWTSDVRAGVKVNIIGVSSTGQTCTIRVAKTSTLFPSRLIYFKGTIELDAPPVIAWTPPTSLSVTEIGKALLIDFRAIQRTEVVLEATVRHNWFPDGRALRFAYQLAGSPSTVDTADIVAEIPASDEQQPRGFLEIARSGGIPMVITTPTNTTLRIVIGPIGELLLDSEAVVSLRFEESAFLSPAFPAEGTDVLEFRVSRYVPNIISLASQIIIQVLENGAVVASAITLPAGIFTAQRMYLLGGLIDCPHVPGTDLPLPFGISIPPTVNGFDSYIVVSIFLVGVCGLFFTLHGLLVLGFFAQRKASSNRSLSSLCAKFFFPAIPCIPLFYFVQLGMMLMSTVIFNSDNASNKIGMVILAIVPAFIPPVGIHGVVWRNRSITFMPTHIQTVQSMALDDDTTESKKKKKAKEGQQAITRFFIPSGFWTHPTDTTYMRRYAVLFVEQTDKHKWFLLAEYWVSCIVGLIMGFQPASRNGCLAMSAAVAALMGIYLVALVAWRPFRVPMMNAAMIAVTILNFTSVCMMTQEQRKEIRDDNIQVIAYRLNIAAEAILLIALLIRIGIRLVTKYEKTASKEATKHWERVYAKEQQTMEKLVAAHKAHLDKGSNRQILDITEPLIESAGNREVYDDGVDDLFSLELETLDGTNLYSAEAPRGEPVGIFRRSDGSALTGGEIAFSPGKKRELEERRAVQNFSGVPFSSRPPEPIGMPSRRRELPPEEMAQSSDEIEEGVQEPSRFQPCEYSPPPKMRWGRRRM